METRIYAFQIRVLLSRDGEDYVAHALEMDLVAYAKSEKESLIEVSNLIENQISYAIEKGEDHLMPFAAPKEYFNEWEKAHAAALKGLIEQGKCAEIHIKAVRQGV
jgi:thiamine monophosphate kinase